MDLESLYYFKELTRDLNMTQTAKRLFLSQQTLSNHIARLEKWCGIPLFYRKPRLTLTTAGFSLLQFADKVLNQEQEFKEVLSDIAEEARGTIRFGASFIRYNIALPAVLPDLTRRYPHVSMDLTDDTSDHLHSQLLEGNLDVILSVRNENIPGLSSTLLLANQIYLLVSDRLLKKYYGAETEIIKERSRHGAHLKDFAKLPFLMLTPPNRMGTILTNCFEEAGCAPQVYIRTDHLRMSETISSKALAATFSTTMPLNKTKKQLASDVNIFPLLYKEKPVYHNLYLAYFKNRYHARYLKYFIELLENYFKNVETMDPSYVHKPEPGVE